MNVDSQASRVLESDDVCRQATVTVIGESVANAAIHGKATSAQVTITVNEERFLVIQVLTAGSTPDNASTPGLGSALMNEACASWGFENADGQTRLTAALASTTEKAKLF